MSATNVAAPSEWSDLERCLAAAAADGATRGGYVLAEAVGGVPEVVLIATGGEEPTALRVQEILEREGIPTRVVSMPCAAWFEGQDAAYRAAVLPPAALAKVSVGAAAALGRYAMASEQSGAVGLGRCGVSSPYHALYEQYGFTPELVAAHARASLAQARRRQLDCTD
ncbi:transketolase C-terminal domain-containing protein [Kitasatospora sp. MMS16-BH015]|uniref:transketolase-like TK C-terminal-containing protein n=1 Tax=Kitasatospora sp. MMS16-BH015 TaxID=2018025 RepID=UPI000CF1E665|nr:transketolase C-terminal domain-containing protein [Kitasatospora sp. MMS16-BH015]